MTTTLHGGMLWCVDRIDHALFAVIVAGVILGLTSFGFILGWHSNEVAAWLSGVGSIGAALVALWIATADRRERRREQRDADRAQAELVQVRVADIPERQFKVLVTNFGNRPVLDVELDSATYKFAPEASAVSRTLAGPCPVLDSDRKPYLLWVDFVDEENASVLPGTWVDVYGEWEPNDRPDPKDVTVWIRFRDASGTRWRRGTTGSVERI